MNNICIIGPMNAGKSTISKKISKKLNKNLIILDEIRWKKYAEYGFDHRKENEIGNEKGFLGVYEYWKQFEIKLVTDVLFNNENCIVDFGGGHSVYTNEKYLEELEEVKEDNKFILLMPDSMHEKVSKYDKKIEEVLEFINNKKNEFTEAEISNFINLAIEKELKNDKERKLKDIMGYLEINKVKRDREVFKDEYEEIKKHVKKNYNEMKTSDEFFINEHFVEEYSNYNLADYIILTKDKSADNIVDEVLLDLEQDRGLEYE